MISKLTLKNFAAFEEFEINFSPKINVIIGENSSGKTQLLKSIYAINFVQAQIKRQGIKSRKEINSLLLQKLLGVFKPETGRVGSICNHRANSDTFVLLTNEFEKTFGCRISSSRSASISIQGDPNAISDASVFIPSKEVISLLPAIAKKEVDDTHLKALFDDVICDLCHRLLITPEINLQKQLNEDPRLGALLPDLANVIGGVYHVGPTHHSFISGKYIEARRIVSNSRQAQMYSDSTNLKFVANHIGEMSTHMTAEGYRKIGVLQRLLENGELSFSGDSPLLWDEPESNMNPKLIKSLVQCLLNISRNGKQVILASHDFVLLKWFDLLSESGKGDHVRYHALSRDNSGKVSIQSTSNYKMLDRNAISDTYSNLYDAEIDRSLGVEL